MRERVLLTGAAGNLGTLLRSRLARQDRLLRLVDVAAIAEPEPGENVEVSQASLSDLDAMRAACTGVDAVIHFGGLSTEHSWEKILESNIHGTYVVFEAARQAGVPRVIFASTNHAVGFRPHDGTEASDYLYPRPDTYYGVSKATGEAIGSLYHDRYGLDVVCIRIGTVNSGPRTPRQLATWLSPDDCARLVDAALIAPSPGFRLVWGVSDNTRRWFSLDEAQSLGYQSHDDAEQHAPQARRGEPHALDDTYLGGAFCGSELDKEG